METKFLKYNQDQEFIAYQQYLSKQKKDKPGIIYLSGYNSDMFGTKAEHLLAYAIKNDLDFVRFDYYGTGLSSGKFESGTINLWLENCLLVIDRLTSGPQILVGSSMGGWLMLLIYLKRPALISGLLGIAAAPDFTIDLIYNDLDKKQKEELVQTGKVVLPSEYCSAGFVVTRDLIEHSKTLLIKDRELDINVPVYLLHGMADHDVPYTTSVKLAEQIKSTEVMVKLIKDGDHRLSALKYLQEIDFGLDFLI